MKNTLSVVYSAVAYTLFLGAFLYLVAFALNLAPHSVSGEPTSPPAVAVLVNIALITIFGLQHSVMARPGFKRWWTQVIPKHLERSTFVMIAASLVIAIVELWQPIGGDIWRVSGTLAAVVLGISVTGWLVVPFTSFLTDHFELFGLRQVYEAVTGRPRTPQQFRERSLYKKSRHPMMLGFIVAMWATPHMTMGHLLFAGLMTSYILTGIYFEERDLVREHGAAYRDYQARVPKLLPLGARRPAITQTSAVRVEQEAEALSRR